jgi:uncharacterized membrane protein
MQEASLLRAKRFLAPVALLFVWILSCRQSFWLDELQTYWVISGTASEVAKRSLETQGFSPLYYYVLWLMKPFVPHSEWVFRLPSLIFVMFAVLLFSQISERLLGPAVAGVAGLILISVDEVLDTALFARPYSLALFASVLSTWCLLKWMDFGHKRYGYFYVGALLLCAYGHFLFFGIFALHLLLLFVRRSSCLIPRPQFVPTAIYIALGLVPLLPQLSLMLGKKNEMAISLLPEIPGIFLHAVPWTSILLVGLAFSLGLGFVRSEERIFRRNKNWDRGLLIWLFFASFGPVLAFFAASHLLGASIFVPRYFMWSALGYSLLLSFYFDFVQNDKLRQMFLVCLLLLLLGAEATKDRFHEDWRAGVAWMNAENTPAPTLTLFYSGVVESAREEWLLDETKMGQFSSPLSFYPLANRDIVVLPLHVVTRPEEVGDYWTTHIYPMFQQVQNVEVLCLNNLNWQEQGQRIEVCNELINRLTRAGFAPTAVKQFERVTVARLSQNMSAKKAS